MSFVKFIKQFAGTPSGILGFGIVATLVVSGSYRLIIKPNMDRQRRLEAERCAEFILENETRRNENQI